MISSAAMIALSNLAKSFGAQTLFEDVNLLLEAGNRYGLVGANGSGKSTLFRIVTGQEEASAGEVSLPRRLRLGLLEQDHFRYENERIVDVVMMGNAELWQAMAEKEAILARSHEEFDTERFGELEDIVVSHDGYAHEARCGEILEGLGIPTELHANPLSTLSGGFKLRVLLAKTLAGDPACLLLDEPTNHLDIISIRWLEKFLSSHKGCVVVISHDHRFLDNVCTHILDVDYETITQYTGNYTTFVESKHNDRDRREAEIAKREKQVADHKAFIDRFKAKATKARQAASKAKMLDRIVIDDLPRTSRRFPRFAFKQCRPSGKDVVTIEHLAKAYGDNQVLKDISLVLRRGDRLAIIGPNGIGKSTLVKIMAGDVQADRGTVLWGHETYPGYFPQDPREALEQGAKTVEGWLGPFCPDPTIGFIRSQLGRVLFSGEEVEKKVASLSGGESARLLFARLTVTRPNVLLLDEPTNHLDLEAIEALVEALAAYDGTLIFVSNDRWFVSRLASRVLEITPAGINDFPGSYDDYLASCGDDHLDADQAVLKVKRDRRKSAPASTETEVVPGAAPAVPGKPTLTQNQRKQLERRRDDITAAIEQAEQRAADIDGLFCKPGFFTKTSDTQVRDLQDEQARVKGRVAELMAEWEKIEAQLGG